MAIIKRTPKDRNRKARARFNPKLRKERVNEGTEKAAEIYFQRKPFGELVRKIIQGVRPEVEVTEDAIDALKCEAEAYLINLFTAAKDAMDHANRVTLKLDDLRLSGYFRDVQMRKEIAHSVAGSNAGAEMAAIKDSSLRDEMGSKTGDGELRS